MNGFPNLRMGTSSAPFVMGNLAISRSHIVDETVLAPAGDVLAKHDGGRNPGACASEYHDTVSRAPVPVEQVRQMGRQ